MDRETTELDHRTDFEQLLVDEEEKEVNPGSTQPLDILHAPIQVPINVSPIQAMASIPARVENLHSPPANEGAQFFENIGQHLERSSAAPQQQPRPLSATSKTKISVVPDDLF